MNKIVLHGMQEYLSCRVAFIEPLILPHIFEVVNRKEIIKSRFFKASSENDSRYYRWCWDIKPHWCENCGKALKEYSAKYISHIKTRGAYTEYRYDPMNSNILCFECHSKWEHLPIDRKENMYIFTKNKEREYLWEPKNK